LMGHSAEAAGETLEQTRRLVQDSIAEARRSIWNLRSADAAVNDLPSRLSKVLESVTVNSAVKVDFRVTGAYRPLPGRTEDEIVRIASEAATNVVRHANASQLRATLAFESSAAMLTLADDGCGFQSESESRAPEGHFGIDGMRERARSIHAKLIVDSTPARGTTVKLELPLS
jgi:signal transduction histidine kinase